MATLNTNILGIRRSKKAEEKTKNTALCKKHPKHRQSPGVCSLCLNERLSHFVQSSSSSSASRRQRARQILCSSSTTSLSSSGSSSVSSCPSPLVDRPCYLLMSGGSGRDKEISWMTKSRSVAAYKVKDDENRKKKKTRAGFFFGLIGRRREN